MPSDLENLNKRSLYFPMYLVLYIPMSSWLNFRLARLGLYWNLPPNSQFVGLPIGVFIPHSRLNSNIYQIDINIMITRICTRFFFATEAMKSVPGTVFPDVGHKPPSIADTPAGRYAGSLFSVASQK